jgi:hypothetical protein
MALSAYVASRECMMVMWKEADVAKFKALSWKFPGGIEENHNEPWSA